MGCSLSVPPASVPSKPPIIKPKIFENNRLMGEYTQLSAPQMFLWPTFKVDPVSGKEVPLTLAEQGDSRQKIVFSAEQIQNYGSAIQETVDQINQKYNSLLVELEGAFKGMRCYSYCDPEDFIFCDPDDESVLFVEDWMPSRDPEMNLLIGACIDNQIHRKALIEDKKKEVGDKVTPLQEQATFHAQNFFAELGDNYYTHFTGFKIEARENVLDIELEFGNTKLSNSDQLPSERQVVDVELDRIEGFLTFRSKAFSPEGRVVGEIFYDLELNFNEDGSLSVQGDIRFTQEGQDVRVGRFSSIGIMQ